MTDLTLTSSSEAVPNLDILTPISDMYTDLERTIWNVLTAGLAARGISAEVINIQNDTTFPSKKNVIRFAKVYDLPNDNAPGGCTAKLWEPIKDVNGNVLSWRAYDYPQGWNIDYKFNLLSEKLSIIREMEVILRRKLKHRDPLYLYDSLTNTLTKSYCEVFYKGSLNQDNSDLGFYSRASIIRFELYDYTNIYKVVPAIASMSVEIGTSNDVIEIVSQP